MTKDPDLRVLVILNRLYEWSQNFITRELCELQRQNVNLTVAARAVVDRSDLSDEEKDLAHYFIAIPENPFLPNSLWRHLLFKMRHLRQYVKAWRHLVTFGHKHPLKLFRSLTCLFRAAGIAQQVKNSKVELIHAHFMTAATETALYLSAMTGIPFGSTSHAMDIYQDSSGQQKKIDMASYLITETKANVDFMSSAWEVESGKLHQIYNSLPQEDFSRSHLKHDPIVFMAVGRLVPKKGFEYLIAACGQMHEQDLAFRCIIVGSGPLLQDLQTRVAEANLESMVEFRGYIAPNDMAHQYREADILVIPSVIEPNGDRDGLPTVCMEALYYGVPLICSDVSGLPECIYEGENGFVVPERDSHALAKAMANCMVQDYHSMSVRSVQTARELFNSSKNVARIKAIMLQSVGEI